MNPNFQVITSALIIGFCAIGAAIGTIMIREGLGKDKQTRPVIGVERIDNSIRTDGGLMYLVKVKNSGDILASNIK